MVTLAEAFHKVRYALDKADVTYAVGVSWASSIHGERRHTNDIDFVAHQVDILRFRVADSPACSISAMGRQCTALP